MLTAKQHNHIIPVYQAMDRSEKIINQTARPDLVYARLTTIDLLLRQVKKDGIGIIFSQYHPALNTAFKNAQLNKIMIADYNDLGRSVDRLSAGTRVIVISLKAGTTIRVSDIESLVRSIPATHSLKWVSILQQQSASQLFKWELKYKSN